MDTIHPQVLKCTILPATGGPQRIDGTAGRQGDLLVTLRLGQKDTFITVTARGELLITAPDADRYSIINGCLHYADCCEQDGEGGPTDNALDFDPRDSAVGEDFA